MRIKVEIKSDAGQGFSNQDKHEHPTLRTTALDKRQNCLIRLYVLIQCTTYDLKIGKFKLLRVLSLSIIHKATI